MVDVHAAAVTVHVPHVVNREHVTPVGGPSVPAHRLVEVLLDPERLVVRSSHEERRFDVADRGQSADLVDDAGGDLLRPFWVTRECHATSGVDPGDPHGGEGVVGIRSRGFEEPASRRVVDVAGDARIQLDRFEEARVRDGVLCPERGGWPGEEHGYGDESERRRVAHRHGSAIVCGPRSARDGAPIARMVICISRVRISSARSTPS
jgi:hypothetical protein